MFTGRAVSATTRTVVTKLDDACGHRQVDMQGSEPAAVYSRYGVGYGGVAAP